MNFAKSVIISTLALMVVLTPNAALASHHSSKSTKENTKITVDTKHNKIHLYKKVDGEWVKVKTEKCCTGKDGATPKGKFKTKSKEKKFTKDGKDYKYVTYFKDNYAIHSTPYDGEYHNNSLGHSRSHGCVRVKAETAEWIYKNIEKGTTIEVE